MDAKSCLCCSHWRSYVRRVFVQTKIWGRADTFGDVRHIQVVMVDLLMQMLAAFFLDAKTVRLGRRITSKGLQFTAIVTLAGDVDMLAPVFRRFGRLLTAAQQELGGMVP